MPKDSKFPDTYAALETSELLAVYEQAPDRLNLALRNLTVKDLQAHPKEGKWSIQEIALHLSDSEIMGATRIRQVIAESGCTLASYDQKKWAEQFDYLGLDSKSFYSTLMLFDSLRLSTAKIFKGASGADWEKHGLHPEWGSVTLRQLLEWYTDHGERHFEQIMALRELLEKPAELKPLLPQRLY